MRAGVRGPRSSQAGLTLIESAAVFGLTGLVLSAFVPTFVAQLRLSKVSEATLQLKSLHDATAAYYARERRVAGKLRRMCLPESAGPTPAAPAMYPMATDFTARDVPGHATWAALGLSTGQVRYSYEVRVAAPGCGPREVPAQAVVTLRAEGDLDGDGQRSSLERTAAPSGDEATLKPGPLLRITQRVE